MHDVLFDLGFAKITTFGFCMAMGILTSFFLMTWLGKKNGHSSEFLSNFVLVLMLSAFIGARVGYVFEHWSEFENNLSHIFNIFNGGIMYYGGLLGAWLGGSIYLLVLKKSVIDILDLTVTVLPLGHAWGRVGCFMNGCCFGKVTDLPIGVRYPYRSNVWWSQYNEGLISRFDKLSLPVIPSQLIEAGLNLLICIVLVVLYRKSNRIIGMHMGLYAIMYALIRFFTESLRGSDGRMIVGMLSLSQLISIGIFTFGIVMLVFSILRNKRAES